MSTGEQPANPAGDSWHFFKPTAATLTKLYGAWIAFQKSYPDRYREAAGKEVAAIEGALGSTCACGGEAEVQKELENFLKAYPGSPMAAKVASRLQAVKNHTSGIRFYCKTG